MFASINCASSSCWAAVGGELVVLVVVVVVVVMLMMMLMMMTMMQSRAWGETEVQVWLTRLLEESDACTRNTLGVYGSKFKV